MPSNQPQRTYSRLPLTYCTEDVARLMDEQDAEVERLREAIHAHRVARRYNPRAPWVDARLWDATGEEV